MSIVEFIGGPVTHRYFMGKTKAWLASEIIDLTCRLARLCGEDEPDLDRSALLTNPKEHLAAQALRVHRDFAGWLERNPEAASHG